MKLEREREEKGGDQETLTSRESKWYCVEETLILEVIIMVNWMYIKKPNAIKRRLNHTIKDSNVKYFHKAFVGTGKCLYQFKAFNMKSFTHQLNKVPSEHQLNH